MKNKLTLLSYISFIFIAIMFTIPNVVLKEISTTFNVETYKIGYALTFFTIGTSTATFFTGYILQSFDLKKFLFLAYFVIITGLTGIYFSHNLTFYEFFLLISGIGVGVLIASSNYILVKIYDDAQRRYKISMLNFFYGFGSILCPIAISQLLSIKNITWRFFYIIMIGFIIVFYIILYNTDTSNIKPEHKKSKNKNMHFTLPIILIGLSLFFYVISEVIFTTWVVTYARDFLSWNIQSASILLSIFWVFMAIGRVLSGILSNKIKLNIYIFVSMLFSILLMIIFLNSKNVLIIYILAGLLGLSYSALYPSILTYGTIQIKNIPPYMVTFFITLGAVGSLASFPISGFIKQYFNIYIVIFFSIIFMLISITLISVVFIKSKISKNI